jgi:O-acetyl-ADP-ribose deacetylase (regulator of RNase III)
MKMQKLEVGEPDITNLEMHAIGNAANQVLLGGGMDEEIHIAAGEVLSSVGAGIYRFPIERACKIAFDTVPEAMKKMIRIAQIIFCMFSMNLFSVYQRKLNQRKKLAGLN